MLKFASKCAPEPAALDQVYRAGFRHTELWLDAAVLADWPTALRYAQDFPLSYALHFPNSLNLAPETLEHTVALYRGLAARCVIIHQPMFDRYGETLLRLDPALALAIENHNLTPEQFDRWAERSPWLTLDVEHLWKYTLRNAPLDALLRRVSELLTARGGKLRHVHLPGYWPGMDEHRPMYCSREMIYPVLSLLSDAGFAGLVVSEVAMIHQNAEELRMDVLLFDAWRRQHGYGGLRVDASR
jgi:sugar phosphate isomerase/epimerase